MITSPFLAAMVGMPELLIIGGILVLLFGATKLPQLAKGLGQSIKEFKKAAKEEDETKPVPGAPKTDSVRSGSPGAN